VFFWERVRKRLIIDDLTFGTVQKSAQEYEKKGVDDRGQDRKQANLVSKDGHATPYPPTNSQGYQSKGFTKFAFHKLLILKGMSLAEQNACESFPGWPEEGKAGAALRTPHRVIYTVNYSRG
jgi:hypothetical protein